MTELDNRKPINLALQSDGAHVALVRGALDRLLEEGGLAAAGRALDPSAKPSSTKPSPVERP
jgi:hypothetical protein